VHTSADCTRHQYGWPSRSDPAGTVQEVSSFQPLSAFRWEVEKSVEESETW